MKAVGAFFVMVLCFLAVSHAWRCSEAPHLSNALQIDAGQGKVVVVDRDYIAYFLSGGGWYRLGTRRLKHVSVGPAGIWGTDTSEKVHKYIAGYFLPTTGILRQLDAGGNGQIVGVNPLNQAWCLRSTSAAPFKGSGYMEWNNLSRTLKYISCGPKFGCWGIDTSDRIFYTARINPTNCTASHWSQIPGVAAMVEVGTEGQVFVVTRSGQIYQRTGISSSHPQGLDWACISANVSVRHVAYDLGRLWIVSKGGILLMCTH